MAFSELGGGGKGWEFWVQILMAFTSTKSSNGVTLGWVLGVGEEREKCREQTTIYHIFLDSKG